MRILGIDPGSLYTGYGVVDKTGPDLKPVAFGRVALPRGEELCLRIGRLIGEMDRLLEEHRPDTAVLEALFHGRNVRSLIVLAQTRGALLGVLARHGVPITEYSPAEVKSAVTGNGRAAKEQVARMVRLALGLRTEKMAADASDALAVAICAAQRFRMDRLASHGSLQTTEMKGVRRR